MDVYDDIFNDQLLQFSPLRFSPSPEPFTPLTDFLPDPLVEEAVGLINNHAISEANSSMGPESPNLVPLPETLTLVQNPPEMDQQELLCNSQGYLQENVPNRQSDQQFLFNQNMLDSFQESDVFAMPYQPLAYLTNGQLDQQSLFNQNMMNPFQEPNDSIMIEHGQQVLGENSGYVHPTMTQSFELPNHLQEQFLSLPLSQNYPSNPTYQHGLVASHFNMYDQPPPLALPNREDEAHVPRMVTNLARINPLPNQILLTPPLLQMPSNSTRTNPLSNQISVTPSLPQIPSSSTRTNPLPNQILVTPPLFQMPSDSTSTTNPLSNQISVISSLPHMPSSFTKINSLPNQISVTSPLSQIPSSSSRNQENVQNRVNQPSPGVSYPTLDTYARLQGLPCTKAFAPLNFNVLGRRNYESRSERGESSSAAQRRRIVVPKRNANSSAANLGQQRLQNTLYSPLYETLGLKIDPHLRNFAILPPLPKKLG